MQSFWQFENRWIITATLQVKTALSIGSRISLMPSGSDLPVIKTPEGIPFIPGSSIKGVIRFYVERILRTMDGLKQTYNNERLWACNPLDEKMCCVSSARKKELLNEAGKNDAQFTELLWKNSCTACRLFGSQWLASRVFFQDAFLTNQDNLLHFTEIRDGVAIDRDLGTAKHGMKYDFETVPKGAEFVINIIVENAEELEVGLLLLALEAIKKGELPIGGKTTRGPGWGKLINLKIQKIDKGNLIEYLTEKRPPLEVQPDKLLKKVLTTLQKGGDHA